MIQPPTSDLNNVSISRHSASPISPKTHKLKWIPAYEKNTKPAYSRYWQMRPNIYFAFDIEIFLYTVDWNKQCEG